MKAVQVVGGAMLAHSVYSLREYNLAGAQVSPNILYEAIIGALVLVISCYSGLKFQPAKLSDSLSQQETSGKNPFLHLETRAKFQDIRAKRAQHLTWKQSLDQ